MKGLLIGILMAVSAAVAGEFAWSDAPSAELKAACVAPDRVFTEEPCDWRPVVTPMAKELVKDCKTAREAVLALAAGLPKATGVYYTTERRRADMNALEALAEKKVSCTGQSILLVCALRAVDIPARVCGLLSWHHIQGNHTWAEAWFDGEWHMIEYNERDFNSAWVMSYIGMLDPQREPMERIKAATPDGKDFFYPPLLARHIGKGPVASEDVTERYLKLSRAWHEKQGQPANVQRLMVNITPRTETATPIVLLDESGKEVARAALPTLKDDANKFAELNLPREGKFRLRIGDANDTIPVQATENAVQMMTLAAKRD